MLVTRNWMLSTARAEPVDGGYRFYAHKTFGSLTPVWTRLGLHAMDTSDPANPRIVHAFLPRDTEGYRIVDCSGKDSDTMLKDLVPRSAST